MIFTDVPNPFRVNKVDNTMKIPDGDVPELHQEVLHRCLEAVRATSQTKESYGLTVLGEAGSGKSHLLARLRKQFDEKPKTVFAVIRLQGAFLGRLWRHTRAKLIDELFVKYQNGSNGMNGLLRILKNAFPNWAHSIDSNDSSGLLDWILGKKKVDLKPYLDEFANTQTFDARLAKVLSQISDKTLFPIAREWLKGNPLTKEDQEKLGLPVTNPSEIELECESQEIVLSLLRLASKGSVLILAYDEVEAIQSGSYDHAVLRQFTTMLTSLLAESGSRVVLTSIRTNLWLDLRKAVESSNIQKLGQEQVAIPPLKWEQLTRVICARLEAEPSCALARKSCPSETFWPLDRNLLEKFFTEHKRVLTPRHLILACAAFFENWKAGKLGAESSRAVPDSTTPSATRPSSPASTEASRRDSDVANSPTTSQTPKLPKVDEFLRQWDIFRKKHLANMEGIDFDQTMGIGLPWLTNLLGMPITRKTDADPLLGDINLIYLPDSHLKKSLGISFCNHEPRKLWQRLDRIKKQWLATKGKRLESLVIIRAEYERMAEGGEKRLNELQKAGAIYIPIVEQQIAELASFQVMLTLILQGKITRMGTPVSAQEYDFWAKTHLSSAVKELLDLIFGSFIDNSSNPSKEKVVVESAAPKPSARVKTSK